VSIRRLVSVLILVAAVSVGFVYLRDGEPTWFDRIRYPLKYEQIVRGHAKNYDLDPALVAAVIYQESKFHADARSDRGAVGLMQLLPETAEGIAERTGGSQFRVSDLYDPEINVRYGAWYLRHLLDHYGGNEVLALAAYNAGMGNVDRWIDSHGDGDLKPSDLPFPETRAYVKKVLGARSQYRREYARELGL